MNFKLFRLLLTFTLVYSINVIRLLGLYRIYNKVYNNRDYSVVVPDLIFLGTTDEYGCITSAGYSYCNHTDSCIRFDQSCVFDNTNKKY